MEIERKWLIKNLPPIEYDERYKVHQFYLSIDPEVRVRSKRIFDGEELAPRITIKGEGTLVREEIEFDIFPYQYQLLLDLCGKTPIEKDYYIYHKDGYEIEVSIVDNGAFIYAEIEFDSVEDAEKYIFPWADAVEVTYDTRYKMKNYWKDTRL